jgi:hypothetical protein
VLVEEEKSLALWEGSGWADIYIDAVGAFARLSFNIFRSGRADECEIIIPG